MKKIGIVTITDYKNYGNRLQNYALQEVLSKYSNEVITIKNSPRLYNKKYDLKLFMRIVKKYKLKLFSKSFKFFIEKISTYKNRNLSVAKHNNFINFTKTYINETKIIYTRENLNEIEKEDIDFFVVGSDQVWNSNYRNGFKLDVLEDVSNQKKKISYAASFGLESIPDYYKEFYEKNLNNFDCLSVRENSGSKIISNLIGKNAEVHIDPTLLLDKNLWGKLCLAHSNKPEKDYILTYFLEAKDNNTVNIIKKIAREKGLTIVNLNNAKDKEYFSIGPSEFLDYFRDAKLVFTDSFHGSAFSIIFERPFVVFQRGNINSRINTLLNKFDLTDRHWDLIKNVENYMEIDFSSVNKILERERRIAFDYLEKALK